jgi:hypothetical protein
VRVIAVACCALAIHCAALPGGPAAAVHTPPAPLTTETSATREDPPKTKGASALEDDMASGDPRPQVRQTVRFDVDALPVATWGHGANRVAFSIRDISPHEYRVTSWTAAFVEVAIVDRGGRALFTAFTGGNFGQGEPAKCQRGRTEKLMAQWAGFASHGWTDDGIDVVMGRGDLDLGTCAARPSRSLAARAAAIVPGFVYGLRVWDRHVDNHVDEQLLVLMPRGAFVSAGGNPAVPLNAYNTGTFTRLTLSVEPESAASANVRISGESIRLWGALRKTGHAAWSYKEKSEVREDMLVAVDVAWQNSVKLGSISFSLPDSADPTSYAALLSAASR